MTPGTLDLTIYRGITFGRTLTCTDSAGAAVDLTGYSVQADVRRHPKSADVEFDLNAEISDEPGGIITLSLSDEETDALEENLPTLRWDLVLTNNSGERFGPFLLGSVRVLTLVSQP